MIDLADWKRWRGDTEPGRLAHNCPDWDFLPTDEDCLELVCCCCEWEDPELQVLAVRSRKSLRAIQDALNSITDTSVTDTGAP